MIPTKHNSPHGSVLAVSMMKDEAPYLLEWFAHHLAVGFTDILVYTNDCSDGTVEMLKRLEELGLGYHRENVIAEGVKPQPSALKHAQVEPVVAAADWLMVFDADEFLCINHPSGHLDGMIADAAARGANGIVITWRIFGSGNVVEWSRDPVTEQYLLSAPPMWRMGWGVKTLFKFDPQFWKLGIHRPSIKNKHLETGYPDQIHWLNGSGEPMENYFKFRGWRSIRRTVGYNWAQLNHYAVKSVDAYALRKFRGNVNNKKDKYNADYWALQDRNEVRDDQVLRHAAKRAEIMAGLLTDPVLAKLHEVALDRAEARLDKYKSSDAYQELKDGLIEASKIPIAEVKATPPTPRDPAKIAAQMSAVEAKASGKQTAARSEPAGAGWQPQAEDHYMAAPIDLSRDFPIEQVENQGIRLPIDQRIFAPTALELARSGKFERRAARTISSDLGGAERYLEVGAGIGFLAMKAAIADPALIVMAQETRGDLVALARDLARTNDLGDSARLKLTDGPLVFPNDPDGVASGFAALLQDFRPDALRLSRGDLSPTEVSAAPLTTVTRILIACTGTDNATANRQGFGPVLTALGFEDITDEGRDDTLIFSWAGAQKPV
jgi:hypothetical protein